MTTIIGIYDDSLKLEKAIEQLVNKGFKEEVIDPDILVQKSEHPAAPGPGIAPVPGVMAGNPAATLPRDSTAAIQEADRVLRSRLDELHLSDEEIDHYTTVFNHDGKFLIVESDSEQASEAADIMRANGASQVYNH